MTEKEEKEKTPVEIKPMEDQKFSNTIKNAHASGDGSIKRSEEAIDLWRDEASTQETDRNKY